MVRKPRYQFLSRKQREAIDWATDQLLLDLLESGDVAAFNTIIGVIQDLKDVAGRVSEDQEKCLQLPMILYRAATRAPAGAQLPPPVGGSNSSTLMR